MGAGELNDVDLESL